MIKSFRYKDEAESFRENKTPLRWQHIAKQRQKSLLILDAAPDLTTLAGLPSNRLEKLKGKRQGQHSIAINKQYRLCFIWGQDNNAYEVETVDYHDE
ncbi:putative plasmid maintenance system killer protein [endosymbiont DhMRE of Dentiscutata heterogama]|uniref:type II toxin-antitoxin system RelE/ParE family toxin n=1 Tax=endosymbiont DhMRE of Dentiscutata heterogama TaxID=1609546 RepID=UPI000629D6B3|nr:type II toxin-antitoxin system RelE/ParE family toxin [endosymbiont DhMRE of Dentiscutata heterogama]CFW92999.1 putative plasmid maintenance system killer protein [endosymbiont DhMRE of Dentiscutata heterogama]